MAGMVRPDQRLRFILPVRVRSSRADLASAVGRAERGMTVEPTTRPVPGGADVAPPPRPETPTTGGDLPARRWRWLPRYTWSGTLGALLFGYASLTPSLLPRGWVTQGIIGGIPPAGGLRAGAPVPRCGAR